MATHRISKLPKEELVELGWSIIDDHNFISDHLPPLLEELEKMTLSDDEKDLVKNLKSIKI